MSINMTNGGIEVPSSDIEYANGVESVCPHLSVCRHFALNDTITKNVAKHRIYITSAVYIHNSDFK